MDAKEPPMIIYQMPNAGPTTGAQVIGTISNSKPGNLIISCGKGNVSISMETGKVTITDCELDEASKAFWRAVEQIVVRR